MNRLCAPTLLFLSLLTSYVQGFAQPSEDKNNKSLLWKISGGDLNKPSYLFGTIHIVCPENYIWTDKMETAFQRSEEVCFEMDMDDPAVMLSVSEGLKDNSGKTLKDYFSPDDYTRLSDYMHDSLGMSIMMFNNMRPSILPFIFSGKSSHCEVSVSYEDKIMAAAHTAGKDVKGLEKPAEQIALFNILPADSVIKDVMDIVNGVKKEDTNYHKLIAAYISQDIPALYEMIRATNDLGSNASAFIDDRNIKWVPRMVDMMDQKSMFFAVGAGHLWGDNGVINLLKKEGYIVSPVK